MVGSTVAEMVAEMVITWFMVGSQWLMMVNSRGLSNNNREFTNINQPLIGVITIENG